MLKTAKNLSRINHVHTTTLRPDQKCAGKARNTQACQQILKLASMLTPWPPLNFRTVLSVPIVHAAFSRSYIITLFYTSMWCEGFLNQQTDFAWKWSWNTAMCRIYLWILGGGKKMSDSGQGIFVVSSKWAWHVPVVSLCTKLDILPTSDEVALTSEHPGQVSLPQIPESVAVPRGKQTNYRKRKLVFNVAPL